MKKLLVGVVLPVAAIIGIVLFFLSAADHVDGAALPTHTANVANGELLYHIGGCISCHRPAEDSGADMSLPSGGAPLTTPIGTLYPPNITPDKDTGIGNWTEGNFIDAVQHGVSPAGTHYIPAFPYISYGRMKTEDVLDIRAYLMTLSPVSAARKEDDIPFPWFLRRGIGLWKKVAVLPPIEADAGQSPSWNRGAYLVNGPGHCAECHTPRNAAMVMDQARAFAGGPHPEGKGQVPNLRDLLGRKEYKDVDDLASALKEGEEGFYDGLAKGGMGAVQQNIAKLPDADIHAIAEYLGSLK